jgi:tRNA G18 (ribose-2'-O)-methylase SpoU
MVLARQPPTPPDVDGAPDAITLGETSTHGSGGGATRLALTILWHPRMERVGERALLPEPGGRDGGHPQTPGHGGVAVALDRVRNPYNVGAILRSAAFFGVDAALLGAPAPHPTLAPDAIRVAEGGAEHLLLTRTTDLADTLGRLRSRGVRVIGADGAAPAGAQGFAFERPVLLVLGHEREGLGPRVRAQCDALVAVRGSGKVESLNVAVAAGVLIAEMVRP